MLVHIFLHMQKGWEELSQADSRYAALDEAYNKYNDEVKQKVDPMEEARGLNEIAPVKNKIIDIKEYQVYLPNFLLGALNTGRR